MDNNHKQNGEDNATKPNFLEICNNLLLFEIREYSEYIEYKYSEYNE